jgi:cell wall-associated NlpC family hydrolase
MTIRRRLAVAAFAFTMSSAALAGVATAAPAPSRQAAEPTIASKARSALSLLDWLSATGDVPALQLYSAQRDGLAADVAAEFGADPVAMQDAWRNADLDHQTALMAALSQIGVRYRRNTSNPGVSFDCSGLTAYAWGRAGYGIAHQSASQIRAAAPRTASTAEAGDILYYPGHVMLYLGSGGLMVHAPYTGTTVRIDSVPHRARFGDPTG